MGAWQFENFVAGESPVRAFADAQSQAAYEHGHGGYTGTIAEVPGFFMVEAVPVTYTQAYRKLREWQASPDSVYRSENRVRVPAPIGWGQDRSEWRTEFDLSDKWAECGCIEVKRGSIPKDVMQQFSRPVTKRSTSMVLWEPPKRGTRFFLFFGWSSS